MCFEGKKPNCFRFQKASLIRVSGAPLTRPYSLSLSLFLSLCSLL